MTRPPLFRALIGVLFAGVLAGAIAAHDARADIPAGPSPKATFALIVGSNRSVDANLPVLRYADDDAARYQDLFRLLGAHTYLLTRLDDNTRRLHPQAAAEAADPVRAEFDRAVRALAQDVTTATARGVETVVYIVYAGHGDVRNGEGYVTLEDARITGGELAQVVAHVPATHVHVIVDACASYFLAAARGPGGERRPLEGFHAGSLTEDPRVGVLLSTSSARESHEWEGFEGGVFSHEVRSGLYGAADADGDGEVSYREIAAFVSRANAAIPNERFRPDVFARAPAGTDTLMDLRDGLRRRLVIDGAHAAHYFMEDARGVRIADAHNAQGQTLSLVRPGPSGQVFLRRTEDDHEFVLPPGPEVLAMSDLTEHEAGTRTRGAAHEAFTLVFALPFDEASVRDYHPPAPIPPERHGARRTVGFASVALGALGLTTSAGLAIASHVTASSITAATPQTTVESRNPTITTLNTSAGVALAVGGAALVTGAILVFWPRAAPPVTQQAGSYAFVF